MRWLVGLATDRRVLAGVLVLGGAGSAVYVTYRAFRRAWNHECEEREAAQAKAKALVEQVERQEIALKKYQAALAELQAQRHADSPARPVLYRVVLTGGPCGGKTTALAELKARLEALGFLVLCMPEIATMLFGGGVPFPYDETTAFIFQKNLLKLQLAAEEAFTDLATQSGRPTVIILDRGAMDGKAYMTDAQWELLMEELKLTPIMLRDQRYDAILHLVTAADGAESFYTLANNAVRTETVDEAIEMDRKTLDCWTGHEHLYIVDNQTPFKEKILRAVGRISKLVGVPAPLAVTRKFLLDHPPTASELKTHLKKVESFEVDQTYLATHRSNERCRIRRRQQGTNISFQHQLWITESKEGEPVTTLMERTLTAREYFIMLKQADPSRCTVSKTLTCFTWGNMYWELNSFKGAQHVAILEVEAETRDSDLCFPDFLQITREVTDEGSYDSYLIASELQCSVAVAMHVRPDEQKEEVVEREISEVLHTLEREASKEREKTLDPLRSANRAVTFTNRLSAACSPPLPSVGGGGTAAGSSSRGSSFETGYDASEPSCPLTTSDVVLMTPSSLRSTPAHTSPTAADGTYEEHDARTSPNAPSPPLTHEFNVTPVASRTERPALPSATNGVSHAAANGHDAGGANGGGARPDAPRAEGACRDALAPNGNGGNGGGNACNRNGGGGSAAGGGGGGGGKGSKKRSKK